MKNANPSNGSPVAGVTGSSALAPEQVTRFEFTCV